MERDNHDAHAPGDGELSGSEGLDVVSADGQPSNLRQPSPAPSNTAGVDFDGRPEEPSSNSKQKCKAPMVLQEQEGLESLLRSMLGALQRIESLLEGQQKDPGSRREPMLRDYGDEEAKDRTTQVSQQEVLKRHSVERLDRKTKPCPKS